MIMDLDQDQKVSYEDASWGLASMVAGSGGRVGLRIYGALKDPKPLSIQRLYGSLGL